MINLIIIYKMDIWENIMCSIMIGFWLFLFYYNRLCHEMVLLLDHILHIQTNSNSGERRYNLSYVDTSRSLTV